MKKKMEIKYIVVKNIFVSAFINFFMLENDLNDVFGLMIFTSI